MFRGPDGAARPERVIPAFIWDEIRNAAFEAVNEDAGRNECGPLRIHLELDAVLAEPGRVTRAGPGCAAHAIAQPY